MYVTLMIRVLDIIRHNDIKKEINRFIDMINSSILIVRTLLTVILQWQSKITHRNWQWWCKKSKYIYVYMCIMATICC